MFKVGDLVRPNRERLKGVEVPTWAGKAYLYDPPYTFQAGDENSCFGFVLDIDEPFGMVNVQWNSGTAAWINWEYLLQVT